MINAEDAPERLIKSVVVQDKTTTFVECFTDVCGRKNATLYCHQSVAHLPDMVRNTPVDISQLSQQSVEHALKQGKTDMHNFNNKRLRDETNDLGRNYQNMTKDRERMHLKREVAMPLNRNEKRQLGDGSKEVEKAVERAERKGLLASKSNAQIAKKVEKDEPKMVEILENFRAARLLLTTEGEAEEQAASFIPASSVPGERGPPLGRGGVGSKSAEAEAQPPHTGAQSMEGTVLGSTAARSANILASRMEARLGGILQRQVERKDAAGDWQGWHWQGWHWEGSTEGRCSERGCCEGVRGRKNGQRQGENSWWENHSCKRRQHLGLD
jgi:hypothetical protein